MYLKENRSIGQVADTVKKAGIGIVNTLIFIGVVWGFWKLTKEPKKKSFKKGYSRRKYIKPKKLPLP